MIKEGDLLWIDNSLKKPFADKHTPPEKKECEPCIVIQANKTLSAYIHDVFSIVCLYRGKIYQGALLDTKNNSRNQRQIRIQDSKNNASFKMHIAYIESLE